MSQTCEATNREKHIKWSADWKKANPTWFRGRNYVDWLNRAIKNDNPHSKIWLLAGISMERWLALFSESDAVFISNRVAPVRHWQEFDLTHPESIKQFLSPSNFTLRAKNAQRSP